MIQLSDAEYQKLTTELEHLRIVTGNQTCERIALCVALQPDGRVRFTSLLKVDRLSFYDVGRLVGAMSHVVQANVEQMVRAIHDAEGDAALVDGGAIVQFREGIEASLSAQSQDQDGHPGGTVRSYLNTNPKGGDQ